ncbi:hypothetical protein NKR23_g6753 [Pleurostoma richardsiae]|uniref:Uncharacterized protein n=1 Tax=Pleurostoma richardsiae TaxID=41990 RepID=A0AA38VDX4_9PEZI|nr:hypothetical protein NKR23_g6753 [Pleurostoma richardsiae]
MQFVIISLGLAFVAWAQSPHVFPPKKAGLEIQVHHLSIGGATKLGSNGSTELDLPFGAFSKRQGTDPTPQEQEGRRPPLFPTPNCFWCPTKADLEGDASDLLEKFTTEEFMRRTRAQAADLRDTCMFYTRTVQQPPDSLSRMATQLACKYGKYSIWHLWPNKINEQNNYRLLNYYGIFLPDNRLYPISRLEEIEIDGKPTSPYFQYFENMSRAMARMCTGQIYLLTQTPENVQQYRTEAFTPNIWASTEYTELTNHILTLTSSLIVINASDTSAKPAAWTANWRTLNMQVSANYRRDGRHPMEGWEPYDLDSELDVAIGPQLKKRADLCADSGVDDEPAGKDLFG